MYTGTSSTLYTSVVTKHLSAPNGLKDCNVLLGRRQPAASNMHQGKGRVLERVDSPKLSTGSDCGPASARVNNCDRCGNGWVYKLTKLRYVGDVHYFQGNGFLRTVS